MFKNATHAFLQSLRLLWEEGQTVTARGYETKELISHEIRIENPLERVYVIPHRDNNIFSTIAETIWVFGGRNDLDYLSRYLPRAAEFSDDGKVWRAGYGPRLRNWDGVDQLKAVANILTKDRYSRRGVMIIFDPSRDYVESKDIPCSNWLHFIARDEKLHLNVAIRSNDVMWGFSGINTFEWSVLQEMMAFWAGFAVGQFTYFIGSLHLYARHYERAQKIISNLRSKTPYDFGFPNVKFNTPLSKFDETMSYWFGLERRIRNKDIDITAAIEAFPDEFLKNCLQMLYIYNRYLDKTTPQEIADLVSNLPSNDFKVAAIEYFSRKFENRDVIKLQGKELEYFQYFWAEGQLSEGASFEEILKLLTSLHHKKTLVYKNSWRKHGEVLSIFTNITRKYDRIEAIITERAKATTDETLLDTLVDLAVYSTKYLTYLAEYYGPVFADFLKQYQLNAEIEKYRYNEGFEPMLNILAKRYHASDTIKKLSTLLECFNVIKQNHGLLQDILINGDWRASDPRKCSAAADLALAAIHSVVLLSQEDSMQFGKFKNDVENL